MNSLPQHLLPENSALADDGSLTIGGVRVADLAAEFGTPLFVYDEEHLRDRCRQAVAAFGHRSAVYATKAFLCRAMADLVYSEGMMLDVASGGELHVALSAGVPASACVLHGNNKSVVELEMAIDAGVHAIVVDSFDEIDRLERLGAQPGVNIPSVLLRITPGVSAHTHEFISTGQNDSKFGFNLENGDALRAVDRVRSSSVLRLIGVHCHIGSNVFDAASFAKAAQVMAEFAIPLDLPELVLGGGLGVPYVAGEEAPTISTWGSVLLDACEALGVRSRVSVEPGRAIAAAAAITVYTVGTVKDIPGVRRYVSVDGGMSDNPRPVLYGSGYEAALVRDPFADRALEARVVGKHCESGDIVVNADYLPGDVHPGDVLAVAATGAYCYSLASNYNVVGRPPVVAVSGGTSTLMVAGETVSDVLSRDQGLSRGQG